MRLNPLWILSTLFFTGGLPTVASEPTNEPPPAPVADLVLLAHARVQEGKNFVVSMEAFNQGEERATDVVLRGRLTEVPGGWTMEGTGPCIMDREQLTCDWTHLDGIDASGAQSFTLTLTAASDCRGIAGDFSVSASNDANEANNHAGVTIADFCDQIADMQLNMRGWSDEGDFGITGTVKNLGPNPAQNTWLDFALPILDAGHAWTLLDETGDCRLESYFDGVFVFCQFGTFEVGNERSVSMEAPACSIREGRTFAAVRSDWDLESENDHDEVTFQPTCEPVAPTTKVPVFPSPVVFGLAVVGAIGGVFVILRQRRP